MCGCRYRNLPTLKGCSHTAAAIVVAASSCDTAGFHQGLCSMRSLCETAACWGCCTAEKAQMPREARTSYSVRTSEGSLWQQHL